MLRKFKSLFGRADLTEENVLKEIDNCLGMIFKGDYFAKKYVGVEVFQKREDLMSAFIEYIKNKAKEISASDNPGLAFREKVIMTIRVRVINDVLMGDEFKDTRDKICEAINRGMKLAEEKGLFRQAIPLVRGAEAFSDQPWGWTKLVHEMAWAEVESLVLRHLQINVFEIVNRKADWWDIYHQAYKEYITDLYRSMIDNIDVPEGFPHPMISAMANDYLVDLDQIVFKGVSEGEAR